MITMRIIKAAVEAETREASQMLSEKNFVYISAVKGTGISHGRTLCSFRVNCLGQIADGAKVRGIIL